MTYLFNLLYVRKQQAYFTSKTDNGKEQQAAIKFDACEQSVFSKLSKVASLTSYNIDSSPIITEEMKPVIV